MDRICRSGLWLTQGLDAEPLKAEELGFIKNSVRFRQMSHLMHLTANRKKATSLLPKIEKSLTSNMSVSEVRSYISNLLQQKKVLIFYEQAIYKRNWGLLTQRQRFVMP